MKLQICVTDAYAAQASRGEACWHLEQTGAPLSFGLWILLKARGGVSFWIPRLGVLPPLPALPPLPLPHPLATFEVGGLTSEMLLLPASHSHPGELRQEQAKSNTSPIQIWPLTEELGASTDPASSPAPTNCCVICHL